MYVTKRNMASAVSNLTKHLEHVSDVLAVSVCSSVYNLHFAVNYGLSYYAMFLFLIIMGVSDITYSYTSFRQLFGSLSSAFVCKLQIEGYQLEFIHCLVHWNWLIGVHLFFNFFLCAALVTLDGLKSHYMQEHILSEERKYKSENEEKHHIRIRTLYHFSRVETSL